MNEVRVAEDSDFESLKNLCDNQDGWTSAFKQNQTSVWTKPTKDSNLQMIKVVGSFSDIPSSVVYDVIHDPCYRNVWDKHMIKYTNIGYLNPNNDISYYAVSCPAPFKNRDFVLQRSWLDTGRELFVINRSVFHNQYPPQKGFVRGFSFLTGYLIRPIASGGSTIYYVCHSDPRGKLPSWMVNTLTHVLAPKIVKLLHKACKEYGSWKLKNNPRLKPWMYPEQIPSARLTPAECRRGTAEELKYDVDLENIEDTPCNDGKIKNSTEKIDKKLKNKEKPSKK